MSCKKKNQQGLNLHYLWKILYFVAWSAFAGEVHVTRMLEGASTLALTDGILRSTKRNYTTYEQEHSRADKHQNHFFWCSLFWPSLSPFFFSIYLKGKYENVSVFLAFLPGISYNNTITNHLRSPGTSHNKLIGF